MYQIIEIESNTPLLDDYGNVRRFDSVENAIELIKELSQKTYKKYKPDVIVDDSWKVRESKRFNSGEYIEPKWINYLYKKTKKIDELTKKESLDYEMLHVFHSFNMDAKERSEWIKLNIQSYHYLHVSNLDRSKIAFTESPQKGMLDRQTQMNVASYLVNHCNIDNDLARYIAMFHANEYSISQVFFAESEDDIVNVYANGPDSCMGGFDHARNVKKDDEYYHKFANGSFCHPTRVYGNSDFKLAYLKDKQGKITARTLVVKDSLHYLRIYGDHSRLESALNVMGYKQSYRSMLGKKIRKIWDESNDKWVLPFLDGEQNIDTKLDDNYHIICDSGYDMSCDKTNGFGSEYNGYYTECNSCGDGIEDEDDVIHVYTGRYDCESYCRHCARSESFRCYESHDRIHIDYLREVDGNNYAEWHVENANYCDFSESYTFLECYPVICTNNRNVRYCNENLIDDIAFTCRIDNEYYHIDLMIVDPWNDSPRSILNEPNDMPENECKESE